MNKQIYTSFIETKNKLLIPQFSDGKTMESKYDPEREADSIVSQIDPGFSFFIITGTGSGILIQKLYQQKPDAVIIAVENSKEDLEFLFQLESVQKLKNNPNIIFTTIDSIYDSLINNYLPAYYGDMKIIERQPWLSHIDKDSLKKNISRALSYISSDYSVQAHFGKIWQHNILSNSKSINKTFIDFNIDDSKKAVIIAAGPSLDNKIDFLKLNCNSHFIISTDTAYSMLQKNNIKSDCVVSIDGQNISYNHFLSVNEDFYKETIFLFDLCSNPDAVNYVLSKKGKIIFFKSGHPLSEMIFPDLPKIHSGSGTVTIAALDFAVKCGFKEIDVLGADFGFINGKSYGKGSYFEEIYSKNENRLMNSETSYDRLLYRTEIFNEENNKKTSHILNSYKISFERYLHDLDIHFDYNDSIYSIKNNYSKNINLCFKFSDFNIRDLYFYIKNSSQENLKYALLPYIAFLRFKNNDLSWEEYFNKAKKDLLKLIDYEK